MGVWWRATVAAVDVEYTHHGEVFNQSWSPGDCGSDLLMAGDIIQLS